jgi:hypothetical protein
VSKIVTLVMLGLLVMLVALVKDDTTLHACNAVGNNNVSALCYKIYYMIIR